MDEEKIRGIDTDSHGWFIGGKMQGKTITEINQGWRLTETRSIPMESGQERHSDNLMECFNIKSGNEILCQIMIQPGMAIYYE